MTTSTARNGNSSSSRNRLSASTNANGGGGRNVASKTDVKTTTSSKIASDFDELRSLMPGTYANLATLTVGEVEIPPENCQIILDKFQPLRTSASGEEDVANRPLMEANLSRIAGSLLSNTWDLNGETIVFNSRARLIDGRHRLTSAVRSSKSLKTVVVLGVGDSSMLSLDSGVVRNVGQVFTILGVSNAVMMAASAGALHAILNGGSALSRLREFRHRPDRAALKKFCDDHPGLALSVEYCLPRHHSREILKMRRTLPAFHYLFSRSTSPSVSGRIPAALADALIDVLDVEDHELPALLDGNDWLRPALLLRSRLHKAKRDTRARLTPKECTALLIKTWNYLYTGEAPPRDCIMWNPREGFPRIEGLPYDDLNCPIVPALGSSS